MPDPGATAAANHGIGFLFTELVKHIKEWKNVREDCDQLQRDLVMCVAFREDVLRRGDGCTKVVREYDEELRELVHDIQDCIERFLYRVKCKDEARWLARKGHAIWTWRIRRQFAKKLKNLNKRLQKSGVDKIRHLNVGTTAAAPAAATRGPIEENPVGIDQAKKELLTVLNKEGHEPARLRVIAVVGFGGSGKTTLAKATYKSASAERSFDLCAWVDRADYQDACGLLKTIILKFWKEEKSLAESSCEEDLQRVFKEGRLKNQRYLIVLDDMNTKYWEWIQNTFLDNGKSSRIMVTVRTLPAANYCSSNRANCIGYVYQMRSLGDEGSKTIACLTELENDEAQTLRQKCDGLPLALVSVGGHFRSTRNRGCPTIQECETLCKNLGSFLHDNNPDSVVAMAIRGAERDPFQHLRDMLMNNFASLPTSTLRDSLQYLGIFPDARHLNRNKITGRWVAEGYAPGSHPQEQQEKADWNFELLVERNIIQPVGISTGRICRAPGIVHEFVRDKSMSENFIRTFDSSTRKQRHKRVRHFVVRGSNTICSGAAVNMEDLSHIRSLTVQRVTDNCDNLGSGSAGQADEVSHRSGSEGDGFFKFSKYKVIRVLDLEECTQVNNSHLENICKLWNLRYLSLGDNVNKVPKEISQLHLLERLHLSKAVETELPVDIMCMPNLIHLSGKFMLPISEVSTQLIEESKDSKLETLSGIVAVGRQGFLLLVPQLKKLRKVKICFGQSSDPIIEQRNPILADAIIGYLKHDCGRSLCLDFKNLHETVYSWYPQSAMEGFYRSLSSDGKYYYLTYLKLHLKDELVSTMLDFIVLLSGLEKLCLSLTSVTQGLVSDISKKLHMLAHLKLKAHRIDGDLEINEGTFQSLESLCFEVRDATCSIPQIHIREGLPKLRSFQLLCHNLADLCGIDIDRLEKLQEIELHDDVSVAARQQWETAARNHRNRPNVLPFLCVDDPAGAAIPAAGAAAQVVEGMPAAVAPAIIAPEGAPLERGHAEHQVASASMAVDEPDEAVPVITTGNGPVLNEDGNAAPVNHEAEIVPVANGAEGGDEPTEVNDDSPYPAKSVASATHEDTDVSPEHSMPNRVILNNNGSESPIDIDEAAPDATIPVQPIREVSNNTADHIASSGGRALHAISSVMIVEEPSSPPCSVDGVMQRMGMKKLSL